MTAAAVLSCAAVFGGLRGIPTDENRQVQEQILAAAYSSLMNVIVKVSGDAVLSHANADALETDAAQRVTAQCNAVQSRVQERIRKLYPELRVGFSYSTLINGFSCELPENLIPQVAALPDVVSVTEAGEIETPQTANTSEIGGFPVENAGSGFGAGQVIAVIDTELDTSHPMFAPLADDVETAVSRADVEAIAESGILNVDIDPDRAYISSKLPYVIDYVDDDRYGGVADRSSYHGTHVCGIAAGNAYEASDGTVLSGIAKDAQLMFFACSRGSGVSVDAAIAGFEDAVKLHADVITMSWGTSSDYSGDNPFTEAVAAADRAGIVICSAAGNSGNRSESSGNLPTPESPDSCTISNKAELGSPLLIAASADNPVQADVDVFLLGRKTVVCIPIVGQFGCVSSFMRLSLAAGEYAYVDCGNGTEAEMAAADIKNKIALVQRSYDQKIEETSHLAERLGALGVILIDTESADSSQISVSESLTNVVAVSYADGQQMREAAEKTILVSGEATPQELPVSVSSFTSWGVRNSLDLRPDIMGIGGRVRSAGYDGTDVTDSGTSMASPYIAGCAAVLREYLRETGAEQEGAALSSYLRRLLMNTAVPFEENGLYVTPRRQGAGLASLENAVSAKVLMTGPGGEAKVNLFDRLGSAFSFEVEITNYSDEDVVFPDAALHLTTDGTYYSTGSRREILCGQQALQCTADFAGPVVIGAGQTETVTVHAELDAAQYEALSAQFRYGFFIEGYLMLHGAENSADISIPVLGFSDDWAQLPVARPNTLMPAVVSGANYYMDSVPLIEYQEMFEEISKRVPDEAARYQHLDLTDYATEDECNLLEYGRNEAWISPNQDCLADFLYGLRVVSYRNAKADLELQDAWGHTLFQDIGITLKDLIELRFDQSRLGDGDYTIIVRAYIDYAGSSDNPQEFRCKLHVDRVAPELTCEYREEYGRKIASLTASDDRLLQGVIVTGYGSGYVAGSREANGIWNGVYDDLWQIGSEAHMGIYPWFDGADDALTEGMPAVLRKYAGIEKDADYNFCDYVLLHPGKDGRYTLEYDVTDLDDYSFTVLDYANNYAVSNQPNISAEWFAAQEFAWMDAKHGIFEVGTDTIRYFDFYDGSVTDYQFKAENDILRLYTDEKEKIYRIECENQYSYLMTDTDTGETNYLHPVEFRMYEHLRHPICELMEAAAANTKEACGKEPIRSELTYLNGPNDITITVILEEQDGRVIEYERYYYLSIFYNSESKAEHERLDPESENNIVIESSYRLVNLFEDEKIQLAEGLYYAENLDCDLLFLDDGSGMILYVNPFNNQLGVKGDMPFQYSVNEDGRIEIRYDSFFLTGTLADDGPWGLSIRWDNMDENSKHSPYGTTYLIMTQYDPKQPGQLMSSEEIISMACDFMKIYRGDGQYRVSNNGMKDNHYFYLEFFADSDSFTLLVDPLTMCGFDEMGNEIDLWKPPYLPEGAYSHAEIGEMAAKDYTDKTGITPAHTEVRLTYSGEMEVMFISDNWDILDIYLIDPVSGEGTDQNGEAVNLPQTGRFDAGPVYLAVFAVILTAAGLLCCMSVLRRKQTEDSAA